MPRKSTHIWEIEYLRPNGETFTCKVAAKTIEEAIGIFRNNPEEAEIVRVECWK